MIKYRYHTTDPEPLHVQRIQLKRAPWNYEAQDGNIYTVGAPGGYLGDIWIRHNCHMKSGGFVYGRPNHLRIGRSHRSVPKRQWRRERDFPRQLCDGDGHSHWYNGDRHRAWGKFRGHIGEVIDLDAFRRLRSMYRKRQR